MSVICERFAEDWELAALGALPDAHLREMEQHVAGGCKLCSGRMGELLESLAAMALTVPRMEPSAELETKLRARIAAEPQRQRVLAMPAPLAPSAKQSTGWTPWLAAAASLALAAVLGWQWRTSAEQAETWKQQAAQRPVAAPLPEAPVPAVQPSVPDQSMALRNLQAQLDTERLLVQRLQSAAKTGEAGLQQQLAEAERRAGQLTTDLSAAREALRAAEEKSTRSAEQLARQSAASSEAIARMESNLKSLQSQAPATSNVADAEVARLRSETERQGKQLADYRGILRSLENGAVRPVALQSVNARAGKASAQAYWGADGSLLVFARDLPALSADKCYQLWLVSTSGPAIASGGVLRVDASGRGVLYAKGLPVGGGVAALAITDEPAGGSRTATGTKLMFGKL
jgi:hypothetical protein